MDRVKSDLLTLIDARVKLVKFVDRTFNCNRQGQRKYFHLLLKTQKRRVFTLSGGWPFWRRNVWHTVPGSKGLDSVWNWNTINQWGGPWGYQEKNWPEKSVWEHKKLKELGNVHIHVDLIAGLPFEDYNSFWILSMKPINFILTSCSWDF